MTLELTSIGPCFRSFLIEPDPLRGYPAVVPALGEDDFDDDDFAWDDDDDDEAEDDEEFADTDDIEEFGDDDEDGLDDEDEEDEL